MQQAGENAPSLGSGEIAIALALRNRAVVLRCSSLLAVAATVVVLAIPPKYTAKASISSQAGGVAQSLGGLAAQIGFTLPSGETGPSPLLYVELAKSRSVLGRAAVGPYPTPGGARAPLSARLGLATGDSAMDRERAIQWLNAAVSASADVKTGLVGVAVTAPDPVLAKDIALQVLWGMDSLNVQRRQTRSGAERAFIERRLSIANEALRRAEDRLSAFISRNRDVSNAPGLALEIERIQRDVLMQREVVTSLLTAYEQARIEEVRDTPMLTVVDPPEVPVRRNPRGTVKWFLLGATTGGAVGLLLALLPLFSFGGPSAPAPSRMELGALLTEFGEELRSPRRLVTAVFRRKRRAA